MTKIKYRYEDTWLIRDALGIIKEELDKVNFNKHQKEMPSPFDNTGISYKNNVFSVCAYNWNDNERPNFVYKDLKVWWYKEYERGTYAECGHELNIDDIHTMIQDCCKSISDAWVGGLI